MPTFNKDDYKYPELPEKEWLLCVILEAVEEPNRFKRDDTDAETQIKISFEIAEGQYKGTWLTVWANPTFGKKANLTKIAKAAFGVEELETLNTDDLKGKRLYVMGDYGEDGKAAFLKPRDYKPASGSTRGRPVASESKPAEEPAREPAMAGGGGGGGGKAEEPAEQKNADLDF